MTNEETPTTVAEGRHFSVPEIAVMWNVSDNTVRRLFRNEPGVIVIQPTVTGRKTRRSYGTLRIPEAVLQRVYQRLSKPR